MLLVCMLIQDSCCHDGMHRYMRLGCGSVVEQGWVAPQAHFMLLLTDLRSLNQTLAFVFLRHSNEGD